MPVVGLTLQKKKADLELVQAAIGLVEGRDRIHEFVAVGF